MPIQVGDNFEFLTNKPGDSRIVKETIAEALLIETEKRFPGLTITVLQPVQADYWFDGGVADENFVRKTQDVQAVLPVTYDLTDQLDGAKTVFNIDSAIDASDYVAVYYGGLRLTSGVNYTLDVNAHTLTYLGTPPDSAAGRHLILVVNGSRGRGKHGARFVRVLHETGSGIIDSNRHCRRPSGSIGRSIKRSDCRSD
jgi:hypothetical protein